MGLYIFWPRMGQGGKPVFIYNNVLGQLGGKNTRDNQPVKDCVIPFEQRDQVCAGRPLVGYIVAQRCCKIHRRHLLK